MHSTAGSLLLQSVAERILARWVETTGGSDVSIVDPAVGDGRRLGVDLRYRHLGRSVAVKVKADSYFGRDPTKIADRDLPFYRPEEGSYAFEAISHVVTREPGWMFMSQADELFYYLCALSQTENDVAALMAEPDEVFFSGLRVDRDELRVLPMSQIQDWFEAHFEEYPPRPVLVGDHSAWYRLIPCEDITGSVAGIRTVGAVFRSVAMD